MEDLSLHILDIVQNSIAAMAKEIRIAVKEDELNDKLIVIVEDNGKGMDEETVKKVVDPFYTTRATRKVGLGVPLLSAAAEACGGSLRINSKFGKGTILEVWFPLSHIDRPPLGNMADTIISLIVCNPDVDFIYEHSTPRGKFDFDTRLIRKEVPHVSLGEPDILDWIRSYLSEGLNEISGGA
ncbi:MAG: ATP-binding protein [Firmicutes bacterium]|nr:ATP-binding protein [Bacillota bacterium]